MKIRKMAGVSPDDRAAVERAFAETEPQTVACCNWQSEFPYAPEVSFRMFHTGGRLMLRFDVAESYTAAMIGEDNGQVWTDSCVEFFIAPDERSYYNFETSCIGRMLLAERRSRDEGVHPAPQQVLDTIERFTSYPFGRTFAEREGENRWSLTLGIPPAGSFPSCADGLERRRSTDEPLQVRRPALASAFPLVAAHTDGEARFSPARIFRGGRV